MKGSKLFIFSSLFRKYITSIDIKLRTAHTNLLHLNIFDIVYYQPIFKSKFTEHEVHHHSS
jgi:hypothetical protein